MDNDRKLKRLDFLCLAVFMLVPNMYVSTLAISYFIGWPFPKFFWIIFGIGCCAGWIREFIHIERTWADQLLLELGALVGVVGSAWVSIMLLYS
jgi:hypothetical protein